MNHRSTTAAAALLAAISTGVRADTIEHFDYATFTAEACPLEMATFDQLTNGNDALQGDEFASQGMTIVQRDGLAMNIFSAAQNQFFFATNFNSQPNGLASADGVNNFSCGGCTDNFDFIFDPPVSAAGIWVGNIAPGSTEVQFLDERGAVIASEVIANDHVGIVSGGAAPWDNRLFYGLVSDTPIERIRTVEPSNDSDGTVYDDVQWHAKSGAFTPGDLDTNGVVDGADLGLLLLAWGKCLPGCCAADLDGSGEIDGADLGILLLNWTS